MMPGLECSVFAIRCVCLVLAIGALSGCAAEEKKGLTLAETKSPAQLLRNEVATRLPDGITRSVANQDFTEACGDDTSIRSWRSSALAVVVDDRASELESIVGDLRSSFEGDGWTWSPGNDRLETIQAVFTSASSTAEILVSATPASESKSATILIVVAGPCVETDGEDSDEVLKLENRD